MYLEFIAPLIEEHRTNFDANKPKDMIDELLLEQQNDEDNFTVGVLYFLSKIFNQTLHCFYLQLAFSIFFLCLLEW